MSMVADDLWHDFLEEAGELLDDVDAKLIDLERAPDNVDLLNAVFRGFHTIKGGAGFLEADALVQVCHKGENLLDALRTGKLKLKPSMMDAILAATGTVRRMFATMTDGGVPAAAEAVVLLQLEAALEDRTPEIPVPGRSAAAASDDSGPDWDALYRAVAGTGFEEKAKARAPDASKPPSTSRPVAPSAPPPSAAGANESLRIDIARFDQILNLTGEIGLSKNRLLNLQRRLAQEHTPTATLKTLESTLRNLNMLVADLQNAVMKARMQQVGRVFQKYARMARDLGRQLGKDVELVIEGASTELDKTLLDQLNDPLVHLIRNAVDHGTEGAADRIAAGKPAKAIVRLGAKQIGDTVVIEITDDGRGIDAAVLRRKAVEKGLVSAQEVSLFDEQKSFDLIFLPGFSTKTEVSNISGRGVGMDVVRTNVQRLSGRIQVSSELGHGTRIAVILPLTLAILPVLMVRLDAQIFALPLTAVRELIELAEDPDPDGAIPASLTVAGEDLTVVALAELLGWKSTHRPKVGVAVRVGGRQLVIAADSFVGRDDVVIKPIQAFRPRGVSGATQSPDGEVVLILDLNELLDPFGDG